MRSEHPLRADMPIRISEDTADKIKKLKVHERVSYNEVINFLATKALLAIMKDGNKTGMVYNESGRTR